MRIEPVALFVLVIVNCILPIAIIWLLIHYMHSRSRSELWVLRDALVDDLLARKIGKTPSAKLLLGLVETHIRVTARHTPLDLLLALYVYRDEDKPSLGGDILDASLSPGDRLILENYLERLWRLSARCLLSSSPSGWLLYLAIRSRSFALYLIDRRRVYRKIEVRPIEREIDSLPSLGKARQFELERLPEILHSKATDRGPVWPVLSGGPAISR